MIPSPEKSGSAGRIIPDIQDACGVFGVFDPAGQQDAARLTGYGLLGLQHRGQDSAGIAASRPGLLTSVRRRGLVAEALTESDLAGLTGPAAIGHVRFAAGAATGDENAQPMVIKYRDGYMALALNGAINNHRQIRADLQKQGAIFQTSSDAETLLALLARASMATADLAAAVSRTAAVLRGAFAMVLLTPDCMIGIRDPQGIRPLCLGEIDGTWILSSESCGIQTAGGRLVRDIAPGEMLVLTRSGMVSERYARTGTIRHCLFEQVYFARADSCIDGMDVHLARFRSGVLLAGQAPVHADLVAGVPDSGITAALGFARASGIPYAQAIIRNASAGRSLQADTPRQHGRSLAIKYAVLNSVVAGKNIVLADDALVHGATLRHLVCRLREAGALTVHLRLASPPVICPCPYGITMPEQHELIAASMDQAALTRWLQADSLACLGLQELQTACSGDAPDQFCSSCFRAAACDDLSLDLPGMTRGSTSSDAIVTGMAPRPDLAQAEAAQTDHSLEGRSHV